MIGRTLGHYEITSRIGQGGTVFEVVKFRTMRVAESGRTHRFADAEEDRITRLGKFLRKTRIDELPQLWNVLKGEMSLIGPRPEQVPFVKEFEERIPFYAYRHLVRSGITGWAQVNQGYAANTAQTQTKLEYDLFYIKHLSFTLDILLIVRTIKTVLTGYGAR